MRFPFLAAAIGAALALSGPADAASRKRHAGAQAPPAKVEKAPADVAAPLDATRLLEAQSALGTRLVAALAGETRRGGTVNVAVSPASLASILALLDLGASDPMHKALHRTLALDVRPGADPSGDLEALRIAVGELSKAQGTGPLTTVNAVLFDEASEPFDLAVAGLQAKGAEVSVGKLADPATLELVNGLVARRTQGLVPTVLDRLPTGAGLVAVNALHFKDRWRSPFSERNTTTAPFRLVDKGPDKRTVDVSMMRSANRPMMFREDERFVAVDLPYATPGFSLVVVTTKALPAAPTELAAAQGWLTGAGFVEKAGEVSLPRFAFSQAADLLEAVDKLGLKPARTSKAAYAGLSPAPQSIAAISQKAVIAVDEKGTEAAAATAVVTARGLSSDAVKMIVDKPFLFALRDQKSGLVLILGYVGDPTGAPLARS